MITPLLPPGLNCSHFLAARERPPGESLAHTTLLGTGDWVCLQTATETGSKFTFQGTFCPICAWRRATKYLIEAAQNWTNRAVRRMSWNALSRNIFLWAVQLMTRGSVRKRAQYEDSHILCLVSTLLVRTASFYLTKSIIKSSIKILTLGAFYSKYQTRFQGKHIFSPYMV